MLYNHTYGYDPQKGNMKDDVNQNISTKVSPIDKDKATIEAEKGELIVAPDLSTIHKITGKKHSRGGSPIKADAGSFLFSDAKDLSFTKKEKELLELSNQLLEIKKQLDTYQKYHSKKDSEKTFLLKKIFDQLSYTTSLMLD